MAQSRSPGYPSTPLPEMIEIAKKLHDANRTNPIDREAAAKDMGYSGLTGTSAKVLSDLSHFNLIEKAGKGGLRVSQTAVDILYPESADSKTQALHVAANNPALFAALGAHFSDGEPSANSLRGYLMRNGFASAAIGPIMKSYTETLRFLREEGASESHGDKPKEDPEGDDGGRENDDSGKQKGSEAAQNRRDAHAETAKGKVPLMEGERVIFMDEVGPGQYLKVVASGPLDSSLIEAMEDFTKRRKKRLPTGRAATQEPENAEDDPDDI